MASGEDSAGPLCPGIESLFRQKNSCRRLVLEQKSSFLSSRRFNSAVKIKIKTHQKRVLTASLNVHITHGPVGTQFSGDSSATESDFEGGKSTTDVRMTTTTAATLTMLSAALIQRASTQDILPLYQIR